MRFVSLALMLAAGLAAAHDLCSAKPADQSKLAGVMLAQGARPPSCPDIAKGESYFAYVYRCGSEPSVYGGG